MNSKAGFRPDSDLAATLELYAQEHQPTEITSLGWAGGLSGAEFWKLKSPSGDLILRRWPAEHPSAERLRWIHHVLRQAAQHGISCLPIPLSKRGSSDTVAEIAGQLWELAPWLTGQPDVDEVVRPARLRAALVMLAQFHNATANLEPLPRRSPSDRLRDRHQRLVQLRGGAARQLYAAVLAEQPSELVALAQQFLRHLDPALEPAIAQLGAVVDTPMPQQPVIRDVHRDHVLFSGDEVSGLIDFGALTRDTPALDIARLLGSLAGGDAATWRAGCAAYESARPLDAVTRDCIRKIDLANVILGGCNWIRWLFVEGRTFADRQRVHSRFAWHVQRLASFATAEGAPPGTADRRSAR